MADFTAQVEALVKKTQNNMTIVARKSLNDVIDIAQTPTAKGGKMRVDTGFLRASGQASLNGLPSGPARGEADSYNYNTASIVDALGKLTIGATFFFGWTAAYAKYREAYDGFLGSALQDWQKIVDKNVEAVNKRSVNQ